MTRGSTDGLSLAGIRVLDLGQYICGPCAAVLLAEMGADVIKVEPQAGDPFRKWDSGKSSATLVAFNRGQRSVVLDLKSDEGRRHLLDLVGSADVLIENCRPGVLDRLTVGAATLRARNPRLVHCSITGFGSSGPRAAMPAYDGVAIGYSGLAGLLLDPEDPGLRGPAVADAIIDPSASFAVLAALMERARTGSGRHVEPSMLAALVHSLHSAVAKKVVEGREETAYLRPHSSQLPGALHDGAGSALRSPDVRHWKVRRRTCSYALGDGRRWCCRPPTTWTSSGHRRSRSAVPIGPATCSRAAAADRCRRTGASASTCRRPAAFLLWAARAARTRATGPSLGRRPAA